MRRSLVLVAVLAGACSSPSSSPPAAPSPHQVPSSSTASASTSPFAVTALTGPLKFLSADRNLRCEIESAYARCDPAHRAWRLPPQPTDCASGWGHGIELQTGTRASFFCGSDSAAGGTRVLAPGHAFTVQFIECDALSVGAVSCHDTADSHGFTISRATYSLA